MKNDNGGAAFPVAAGPGQQFTQGMSLRDWFAGQAMQAQLTYGKCRDMTPEGIAEYSYEFADAMLAERNKDK